MNRIMDTVTPVGVEVESAYGSYIVDSEGNTYLDWFTDNGVTPLGYNPILLRDALAFASKHPHRQPQVYGSRIATGCAEALCASTEMDRLFFCNAGTEATEAAIKMARLHHYKRGDTNRYWIATLPGNFHGRTGFAMAAGDSAPYHREGFGPMPDGFAVVQPDGRIKSREGVDIHHSQVAAIITAPILGNNVVEPYPQGKMEELRAWCDEHGALLIFDEIQTGSGRCGSMAAWKLPQVGVKPDIMCLGKGVAMGLPLGVTLAHGEVANAFTPGTHFSTFGGSTNIILEAAARMTAWVESNEHGLNKTATAFHEALRRLDWVKKVTAVGMMVAIEPDYDGYNAPQLCEAAKEVGLLIVAFREHGQIKLFPPLNSPIHELTMGVARLDRARKMLR